MIQKSLRQSVLTYLRRGVQYASGLFPKLKIPLTRSAIPTSGVADFTFSRSTAATVIDFEGQILTTLINELRFPGARRVRNLLSNTETLSTQTVTVVSGRSYILSFSGTGSVTLSGAATGTLTGSTGRVQITKVASTVSLTLTVSGSVLQAQLELVVGTQSKSSEYVSSGTLYAPYHGAGVDGVKYFATDRDGNSLDVDGALIEPGSTNMIPASNDFSTIWTTSNSTIVSGSVDSPVGKNGGTTVTCSATGTVSLYLNISSCIPVVSGTEYTQSVYAKAGTTNFVSLTFNSVYFNNLGYAVFDLSSGTVNKVVSCKASISPAYDGYYRCSIKNTASSTGTHTYCTITPSRSGAARVAGVAGDSVHISAAQTEVGQLTSYIPTSGTTVTKTADLPVYNVADVITQGQGSLYCEVTFRDLLSSTTYFLSMDDSTSSNRISLYISSGTTLNAIMTSSGTSTVTSSLMPVSKDSVYKIMVTYENNSFKVYINGTIVLTDTSCTVPTTLSYLRFSKYDNSGQTNMQVKDFMYYKEVLNQSEAERRTS